MEQANMHNDPYLLKLKSIRTFVLDMDGVLTNGHLLILGNAPDDGNDYWVRQMHVRDGYALRHASGSGYNVVVVSGSNSQPVEKRLRKLGIEHVYFGIANKEKFLREFFGKYSLAFDTAVYLGDDIPDLAAMELCAISACPADAADEVLATADYISRAKGGEGFVRDVISKVMTAQGKWRSAKDIPST